MTKLLVLCGGGKDSLVSMRLLERAGVDFDAFVYSYSTYGRGQAQHLLVDAMVAHCRPGRVHRAWILDDSVDAPISAAYPQLGISRIVAAETVSSSSTALPVALQHGFIEVALGITRSATEHNLVWNETGEAINYLWGMSAAAEQLLHSYVQTELAANLTMFHLLRPIYDVNVFALLRRGLDAVPATHSCAQAKPWCHRCAKCLYVWDELRRLASRRHRDRHRRRQPLRRHREPRHPSPCSAWRVTSQPTAWARSARPGSPLPCAGLAASTVSSPTASTAPSSSLRPNTLSIATQQSLPSDRPTRPVSSSRSVPSSVRTRSGPAISPSTSSASFPQRTAVTPS